MSGFFILGFFFIVVGIPVIVGCLYSYHESKLKLREKELEHMGAQGMAQLAHQGERVEWLEERMRVLERIVTDKGVSLASEIEGLRDQPAVRDMRAD